MAHEIKLFDITLLAAADLSAKQYYFVKVENTGSAALCGAGELAAGVLQDKPTSGQAAQVRPFGISKVVAGAAIAAGARVACDAAGKAKTAVAATVNTSDAGAAADPVIASHVVGIALDAAAADGEIISVLLLHMGAAPTTAA